MIQTITLGAKSNTAEETHPVSIALTPYNDGQLCHGHTWVVSDLHTLASEIARVAVGQAEHVAEIFVRAGIADLQTSADAIGDAVKLLTAADEPYHRDGWIFQVMSWIAAHRASPGSLIRAPHMVLAHKGFDGVQVELVEGSNSIVGVIIFEDKATTSPRNTIRDKVWPEFRELEQGKRQNLLTAEVASLLRTAPAVDANAALRSILWGQVRKYRVAITTDTSHTGAPGRARLFKEFDEVVPGLNARRRGETFAVPDLRGWMDSLAQLIIAKLSALPVSNV